MKAALIIIGFLGFSCGIITIMFVVSNWLSDTPTISNELAIWQQIPLSIMVIISGFVTAFVSIKKSIYFNS